MIELIDPFPGETSNKDKKSAQKGAVVRRWPIEVPLDRLPEDMMRLAVLQGASSAAGIMPLSRRVKPPAKPVVMIRSFAILSPSIIPATFLRTTANSRPTWLRRAIPPFPSASAPPSTVPVDAKTFPVPRNCAGRGVCDARNYRLGGAFREGGVLTEGRTVRRMGR